MKNIQSDYLYDKIDSLPSTNINKQEESLEDVEIDKYIRMISVKGYGHSLEDQRKRVKAGCIIARHLNKREKQKDAETINKLVEALKNVLSALNDADFWANRQDWEKIEKAKQLLQQIEKENKL